MFEPKRKPQTYLLKCNGKKYFLCKQASDGIFHKIGTSYDQKTILYRLETAAKLGDTVVPEEGNEDLASLVRNFARHLEKLKDMKTQQAIKQGLYVPEQKSSSQTPA